MRRRDFIKAAIGTAAAWPISSRAESFPSRPITLIVPFAAGGPTDVLARILAEQMRRTLGQTVVIENVTGASGRRQSRARHAGRLHHHHRSLGNACSQRRGLFAAIRCPQRLRPGRPDRQRSATHHRQAYTAGAEFERTGRLAEGQPEQGDRRDRGTRVRLPCRRGFLPEPDRDRLFLCALSRRRSRAQRPDGRAHRSDVRSGHQFVAASARRQCASLCRDLAHAACIRTRYPDGG